MKTNFDGCCESVEMMAQVIDIMKCGWTKEQIIRWLKQPLEEKEEIKKIKIVYLSDIAQRLDNTKKILLNMERGDIINMKSNSFSTSNAIYVFINCIVPERVQGVLADQVIIDYREPMRSMAKDMLRMSCVPEEYQIIDDRGIDTSDSPLFN